MKKQNRLVTDVNSIWNTVREVDVSALQMEAARTPRMALVGSPAQTNALHGLLHRGPSAIGQPVTAAPTYRLPLDPAQIQGLRDYDLCLILLEHSEQATNSDLRTLAGQPSSLLAVLDAPLGTTAAWGIAGQERPGMATDWQVPPLLICPLDDMKAVSTLLLPSLMNALPGRELALARAYPALRPLVSKYLIQEAATSNAAYAFTTGIGELAPILALPLTAADMIVLSKNQVLLAYKLALVMGETGTARQVLPQLASVVGAGFIWRQLARELVGLIPAWGLVPKVAVAYAGTMASGQAVYHWYATGEKLREQDLKAAFQEALQRGRSLAAELMANAREQGEQVRDRVALPGPLARRLGLSRSKVAGKLPESPGTR